MSLLCNFETLEVLLKTFEDSQKYEAKISKILQMLAGESDTEETIDIQELYELENQVALIKIEVEKIKQFRLKIQEIREIEENCIQLI
jgi:hypothetical protein